MKKCNYAKINLALNVTNKSKPSSYHDLDMINFCINIKDSVSIKFLNDSTDKINVSCNKKDVPIDENNLVCKVINKFKRVYKVSFSCNVFINKNIPLQAGLAGGSSDAATVINAINKIYKLNLKITELRKIALEFGTDIVYCLENKLAVVGGIGEIITPIKKKIKSSVLVINPNISVLTKDVFKKFDENNDFSEELTIEEIENTLIE